MRDFYDIHILTSTQTFDTDTFKEALQKTSEQRGTTKQVQDMRDTIAMLAEKPVMINRWTKYSKKYGYASGIAWEAVMNAVKRLGMNKAT